MIRVLFVEADGAGAAQAVAELAARFGAAAPSVAQEVELPPAEELPALPSPEAVAPAKPRRAAKRGKAKPAEAAAAAGLRGCRELILEELERGPKTIKQLMDLTGYSYGAIFGELKNLSDSGRIDKSKGEDGRIINQLKGGRA